MPGVKKINNIIIRSATYKDIDSMTRLLGDHFTAEADFRPDPEHQRRGIMLLLDGCMKHKCIQVAECCGCLVGMGIAQILISTAQGTPVALVEDMVVAVEYRRRGIGKSLLKSIEVWAQSRGATRFQLLADRTNTSALSFYRSLGWEQTQLISLRRMSV